MGAVREVAIRLDAVRRREFRRLLVVSALLHLVGFTLLAAVPTLPVVTPAGAIAVNLVAAPSPVRATPAPPAPRPKPPKPAPVVLPREPTLPEPEPTPREKAPPEPEAPPERDYGDVLAQLRAELGEEAPEGPQEPVQTAGAGAGPGRPLPPEVARWLRDARIHVRSNWTLPGNFRMQSLTAVVKVELDAAGNVKQKPRIERRSGNPWYDDGVVRSIQKASPLPAPPEAATWTFVFTSDEEF